MQQEVHRASKKMLMGPGGVCEAGLSDLRLGTNGVADVARASEHFGGLGSEMTVSTTRSCLCLAFPSIWGISGAGQARSACNISTDLARLWEETLLVSSPLCGPALVSLTVMPGLILGLRFYRF